MFVRTETIAREDGAASDRIGACVLLRKNTFSNIRRETSLMFGYITVAEMKANARGTLPCHTRRPLLLSQTRTVADTLVIAFTCGTRS